MNINNLQRISNTEWKIDAHAGMHVPAIIYASEELMLSMDDKVYEQVTNVARLPGIVKASYAMPDAHWGYGFPIGGVAAFDADQGGVISAGGVGFDISCGVRTLNTGLSIEEVMAYAKTTGRCTVSTYPRRTWQHRKHPSQQQTNEGNAQWRCTMGDQ